MEIIDLYDCNRKKLSKTFIRGKDKLLSDEYYLLEQVWIINDNNEFLLTKRAPSKSYGGMWEATAGHVKSGENCLHAIMREVWEEVGLTLKESDFSFVKSILHNKSIIDVWIVRKNIDFNKLVFNSEVTDAKFVSIDEFIEMYKQRKIVDNLYYFVDIYYDIINN